VNENNIPVTDTLAVGFALAATGTGTGAAVDPSNGNVLFSWGATNAVGLIWEVNSRTGAGVRRIRNPAPLGTNAPASIAVNQDGEIYFTGVLNFPGQILNPDMTAGVQFSPFVPAIGRSIAVLRDGKDVYVPRFTVWKTYQYHSDNGSLGPYTLKDSLFLGASVECIAIYPTTGYIWFSNDRRRTDYRYRPNRFYGYNPATRAIVDSFTVSVWDTSSTGPLPRGLAFSPTGDTVYVGHFDVSTLPAVVRFIRNFGVSVERDPSLYRRNTPWHRTTPIHSILPRRLSFRLVPVAW